MPAAHPPAQSVRSWPSCGIRTASSNWRTRPCARRQPTSLRGTTNGNSVAARCEHALMPSCPRRSPRSTLLHTAPTALHECIPSCGWASGFGPAANGWPGSCAVPDYRVCSGGDAGARSPIPAPIHIQTWSTGGSPPTARTGCGAWTSPDTAPARAGCTARSCSTRSSAGS